MLHFEIATRLGGRCVWKLVLGRADAWSQGEREEYGVRHELR